MQISVKGCHLWGAFEVSGSPNAAIAGLGDLWL